MGHGRGRRAAVAAGLVVFALGLPGAPASADPGTVPTMTAPTDGATVSGAVPLAASSEAPLVQFYVDDATPIGVPVTGGTPGNPQPASAAPSPSSFAAGTHTLTAADFADGTPTSNA